MGNHGNGVRVPLSSFTKGCQSCTHFSQVEMDNSFGGIYRIQGSSSQLQFRISLNRIGSSIGNLPPFSEFSGESINNRQSIGTTVEERIVKWQEKLGRKRSTTENTAEAHNAEVRLFSYVNGDQLPPNLESFDSGKSSSIQPRQQTTIDTIESWKRSNPVIDFPLKEDKTKLGYCQKEVMYIMAYLGPLRSEAEEDPLNSFVVCRLTYLNNRSLIFEPPLTPNGYRLESRHGVYTTTITVLEEHFTEIGTSLPRNDDDFVGEETFDIPAGRSVQYTYYIEIEKGLNFPHESIFIEYKIILPNYFQSINTQQLQGRSTLCAAKECGKNRCAYFGHVFEMSFIRNEDLQREGEVVHYVAPQILFRVCSQDYWGRFHVSEYGSAYLPMDTSTPLVVHCWRPIDTSSALSSLREFFVGQSIDFIDYFTDQAQLPKNSRVGLETQSSGSIFLQINRLIQSKQYVTSEMMHRMKYGSMLYKIGINSNLHWRIMKVLLEFEEARKELLRVRGVKKTRG